MNSVLNMSDEEFMEKMNNGEFDDKLTESAEELSDEIEPEVEEETSLEHPVTDSSNVSNDDEVEGEITEDPTDAVDDGADHVEAEKDDKSKVVDAKAKESEDDVLTAYLNTKSKLRANGAEFEFTNAEKLEHFDKIYAQAMDYTRKTQALAPFRKRIAAMEELGVTDAQFNMMLDVLKGDKNAITAVLKQHGVDALELDTDAELDYVPNNYGKSDKELDIEEVFAELKTAPKGDITADIISRQWDDRSRVKLIEGITLPSGKTVSTVEAIKGLQWDVENGVYEKVLPDMLKLKHLDGARKSDIEYYIEAGQRQAYSMNQARLAEEAAKNEATIRAQVEAKLIAEAKAKQEAARKAKEVANRKKAAGVSHGASGTTRAIDYLDMDNMTDEEFMAFMEKQIGR